MNQILQYVILSGVIGISASAVFVHVNESLYDETISQYDKIEIEKKQSSEHLKLIEIIDSPLYIDVINLGADTIIIKKLFIDGVIDEGYLIDGVVTSDIVQNKVVTITPSISGDTIYILSENYKVFDFE